jgi:hypothetical protein
MNIKRLAITLAGAVLASALLISAAAAHRGPVGTQSEDTYVDVRAPDSVERAAQAADVPPPPSLMAAGESAAYTDLRMPDSRTLPSTVQVPDTLPAADTLEPSEPSGFDVVSALVGAVAAAALSLLLITFLGLRRPAGERAASA